jgi:hypothetical protein
MSFRKLALASIALIIAGVVHRAPLSANGQGTRLLRSPTISATQIAFAYANNIWIVERAGGTARRLTSFQGQTSNPHLSPDEIAIGHSYVRGGEMPDVPPSIGGLLGADFTIESGRYKITRVYDNESWNVDLRAPDNIYRLLDGTSGRQTVIAVNSRPAMDGARSVIVLLGERLEARRSRVIRRQGRTSTATASI